MNLRKYKRKIGNITPALQIATYASDNLVVLDIYLRDPYVKLYMRREKITVISFIGNVGGLLGLFLGFSFISGIEVFFMLCLPATSSAPSSAEDELSRKGRKLDQGFQPTRVNNFFPSVFQMSTRLKRDSRQY